MREKITEDGIEIAKDYFNKIPDAAAMATALQGMTTALAQSDPEAAVALMDANPSLVRDEAVRLLIYHAGSDEPELVANNIGRIQNKAERDRAYRNHIDEWLEQDMEVAINWVSENQNKLSENNRNRMPRAIEAARKTKEP